MTNYIINVMDLYSFPFFSSLFCLLYVLAYSELMFFNNYYSCPELLEIDMYLLELI